VASGLERRVLSFSAGHEQPRTFRQRSGLRHWGVDPLRIQQIGVDVEVHRFLEQGLAGDGVVAVEGGGEAALQGADQGLPAGVFRSMGLFCLVAMATP